MLLVVLGCLKDRAFHIRTVYVNSLDPNGIVRRLGKSQFRKWAVGLLTKVCACGLFVFFSIIRSLFDAIFSQDVAKEGS